MGGLAGHLMESYQFCSFIQDLLCLSDCRLPLLAACFLDLIELLVQVGLHQLQLVLVAGEHLRASICI